MNTITARKMQDYGPYEPCTVTAETLFESLPEDGTTETRWQGFGYINGTEQFATRVMRRSPDGTRIDVLRSNGNILMAHPLGTGRTIRTFRHAA